MLFMLNNISLCELKQLQVLYVRINHWIMLFRIIASDDDRIILDKKSNSSSFMIENSSFILYSTLFLVQNQWYLDNELFNKWYIIFFIIVRQLAIVFAIYLFVFLELITKSLKRMNKSRCKLRWISYTLLLLIEIRIQTIKIV